MNILVTGASGMLGTSLLQQFDKKRFKISAFAHKKTSEFPTLDILKFKETADTIKKIEPDIVIHLAAETNVDTCELDSQKTLLVNFEATKNIANTCREIGSTLFFISTGAVFSGTKNEPYYEEDEPNPINVYGLSKYSAEQYISQMPNHCIIRAGWLIGGGAKDKKFVSMILSQLRDGKKELFAVENIVGSPTLTSDFAKVMVKLIKNKAQGIYHVVNEGVASRYEIAKEVVHNSGFKHIVIKPVTFGFFKEKAKRPPMEALYTKKLNDTFSITLPHWKKSLKTYIKTLSI